MRFARKNGLARAALLTVLSVLAPAALWVAARPMACAQSIGARPISGQVVESDNRAAPGATVFLKNLNNKSIRSYSATENGQFRFAEVNTLYDYELWAEKDGRKSAVKTVSNWDTRKEFITELKLK